MKKNQVLFALLSAAITCGVLIFQSDSGLTQEPAAKSRNTDFTKIQPRPTNQSGSQFDQTRGINAERRMEFQQAVDQAQARGARYSNMQTAAVSSAGRLENDPGLPLGSQGQIEFERGASQSSDSGMRSSIDSRIRKVAFPGNQTDNVFRSSMRTPQQHDGLSGQTTQEGDLVISPCPVEFIDKIQLPALETGQIISLFVKEGDAVANGKIVGQIDDQLFKSMFDQAKFKHDIADQKAKDNTSLLAAKNEIALAQVEYDRTKKLASTGSKSQSEYEKARFSLRLAMLKEVAAQNEKESSMGELKIEGSRMREVSERIRRHAIVAPTSFEGHVIEILRHELEWVDAGEPVMRIARMDRLWVQGVVDANVVNPHEIVNRPVTVTLRLARGETTDFQGKIVHVGLERESSDRFLVKAEVQNRPIKGHWVLQPNSTVTMRIHLGDEDTNTASFGGEPAPIQNR